MMGWKKENRLKERKRSDLKRELGSVPTYLKVNPHDVFLCSKGWTDVCELGSTNKSQLDSNSK